MRSWGMELEWANIDKTIVIPKELGVWEGNGNHSEIDIINGSPSAGFEAAWPNQRFGGEINTTPTDSIDLQVDNIRKLYCLFQSGETFKECPVDVSPISNGHVHIYDDAFHDLDVLKKLYKFVIRNQEVIINYWLSLDELTALKKSPAHHPNAFRYLRNDGGKKLSSNFSESVDKATTIEEFQRALVPHAKDSGNILWARAGRQGINLHSLRHTGTVEFRCMKASVNSLEIRNQLTFANEFVDRVINDGPDYTEAELKSYIKPPIDPNGYFQQKCFLDGLNDWWFTREQRKNTGIKKRVGFITI